MKRNLFRKKMLDRISSPEQLNDYIRVTNPGPWMVMSAVIILLTGICVWSVFGRLDTLLNVGAITQDGKTLCYVKEADADKLERNMPVRIEENQYHIQDISPQPIQMDETFPEYLHHVGDLAEGEWVYVVTLDQVHGENGTIELAQIVIESIAPMSFMVN